MKVGVVGGGIIGLATGKLISEKGHQVSVFEKDTIGSHQSGNNSGVLHCGLHYKPGSLKAKLAVEGVRKMIEYCRVNDIDHDVCGKVVVANSSEELSRLEKLALRGKKNGLKGLQYLNNAELKKREPYARAIKALLVPEEGIVDYKKVLYSFKRDIEKHSGKVFEKSKVHGISGIKRLALLSRPMRYWKQNIRHQIFIIGCGLHNLRVRFRSSAYARGAQAGARTFV
ncbi:MAG: FAD-dependent oxidoreductase [Phaeodactylibacter sp.]|uniref:NAD(P)/FAD-dependent oxidoreductase n=1 Tax=Phaeodactylibacter sp. TaxID=1940289 RepID=UPI0032EFE93A